MASYTIVVRLVNLLSKKKGSIEKSASAEPFLVTGKEGTVLHFAKCCYPIPGDPISGFFSRGKGIVIHRKTCPEIIKNTTEKTLIADISWDDSTQGNFSVRLMLSTKQNDAICVSISATIVAAHAAILEIAMMHTDSYIQHLNGYHQSKKSCSFGQNYASFEAYPQYFDNF